MEQEEKVQESFGDISKLQHEIAEKDKFIKRLEIKTRLWRLGFSCERKLEKKVSEQRGNIVNLNNEININWSEQIQKSGNELKWDVKYLNKIIKDIITSIDTLEKENTLYNNKLKKLKHKLVEWKTKTLPGKDMQCMLKELKWKKNKRNKSVLHIYKKYLTPLQKRGTDTCNWMYCGQRAILNKFIYHINCVLHDAAKKHNRRRTFLTAMHFWTYQMEEVIFILKLMRSVSFLSKLGEIV